MRERCSYYIDHYYTVYLVATNEIVTFGSAAECARQLWKTILGLHSLVNKNRLGKQHKYIIVLDDNLCEDYVDDKIDLFERIKGFQKRVRLVLCFWLILSLSL